MGRFRITTLLCCLACYSGHAAAEDPQQPAVYRCLQDGKVSYTDQPCPQEARSSSLAVPPAPAADPEQAAELARQAALAEQLRQQRELRNAKEERAEQRSNDAARKRREKCARLQLAQRWAVEDANRAPVPQREAAQLKASRAAQTLAQECAH